MDEKDKPITDKENFPQSEPVILVPVANEAYAHGCLHGYRSAMMDIMIWSVVLVLMVGIISEIHATD